MFQKFRSHQLRLSLGKRLKGDPLSRARLEIWAGCASRNRPPWEAYASYGNSNRSQGGI